METGFDEINLKERLEPADQRYFSDRLHVDAIEVDLAGPALVWDAAPRPTNSPNPSRAPWPLHPKAGDREALGGGSAEVIDRLGQVLSGPLGRSIAAEVVALVLRHKPGLLAEIQALERFKGSDAKAGF